MHIAHTLQSVNNFFVKHIILSFNKLKHLWGIEPLELAILAQVTFKHKDKPMALHFGNMTKNANTMEKKFCGS